jgi:hypothetical protein
MNKFLLFNSNLIIVGERATKQRAFDSYVKSPFHNSFMLMESKEKDDLDCAPHSHPLIPYDLIGAESSASHIDFN